MEFGNLKKKEPKEVDMEPFRAAVVAHPRCSGLAAYGQLLCEHISELWPECFYICNKSVQTRREKRLWTVGLFGRTMRLPFDVIRLVSFIIRRRICLVHFQSFLKYIFMTHLIVLFLRGIGKKIVFTVHDVLPHYPRFYHRLFLRKLYEGMDGIIVHSRENMRRLLEICPQVSKIVVIPHPVYDFFDITKKLSKQQARKIIGVEASAYVLLFFGRIDKRKGADVFIQEFEKIIKNEPKACLILAGITSFKEDYLKSLIEKHGSRGRILVFDRWIQDEEVQFFFRAADAVILPYLEGSTSGVAKVALAFDTPIVGTNVGDLPEIVEEYGAGILVDMPLTQEDVNNIINLMRPDGTDMLRRQRSADLTWKRSAERTVEFWKSVRKG